MGRLTKQKIFFYAFSGFLHILLFVPFSDVIFSQQTSEPISESNFESFEVIEIVGPPNSLKSPQILPRKMGAIVGQGASQQTKLAGLFQAPKLIQTVKIEYPEDSRRAGHEGDVSVFLTINQRGRVEGVEVAQAPSLQLADAAVKGLRQYQFNPARRSGQAVPVRIQYIYRFRIEKK